MPDVSIPPKPNLLQAEEHPDHEPDVESNVWDQNQSHDDPYIAKFRDGS